jgi:predicted metalloprotease with PDZ domain
MSGPKHLWSGDWQNESVAAEQEIAARPVEFAEPEPIALPAPPPRQRDRRERPRFAATWTRAARRTLLLVLAAVLVFVAVGYGLSSLFDSTSNARQGLTAAQSPKPIQWLGMEIETVSGSAVIETVGLGSEGNTAGLEPGDVIDQINSHSITDTGDIGASIRGLPKGDVVRIQVHNGTAQYETGITLAAPPSAYP